MTTVLASSLAGIHQNSNLTTGGGTDDTSVLQTAINVGNINLVIDGVSLITGLDLPSNTTLTFLVNCGFYLQSGSNREAIRNVNRSASVITDTNVTLTGPGFINGNKAGQSGVAQSDHTPMCGCAFYGISNLIINGGLEIYNSAAWNLAIGNFSNVTVDHVSLMTTSADGNLNTDGVDLRGPGNNAALSNLTILAGDDSIALNSRNYASSVVGPFITGGGDITNVTISNVNFLGSLFGIDLISDGQFKVDAVGISNLKGTVENYALSLSLDLFNTPLFGNGDFRNITLNGSSVTQVGSPYGGMIPPGLYIIQGITANIKFSNITPQPQTVNLSVSAAIVTGLQFGNGSGFSANGPLLVNMRGLTFVQAAAAVEETGASITATFGSTLTSGSFLIAYLLLYPNTLTITSIGDTVNAYVPIATGDTGTSGVFLWEVIKNTSASALTVSVNFSGSTGTAVLGVMEYIGQTASPVDVVSALKVQSSTTFSSPTITTSQPNETVLGLGYYSNMSAITAGTGYTLRLSGSEGFLFTAEDGPAATPGSYTPTTTSPSSTFAWFTIGLAGQSPALFPTSGSGGTSEVMVSRIQRRRPSAFIA